MITAREHLNWCVERAMEYANAGDMTNAWNSFISDTRKHPDTKYISSHDLLAMTMLGGFENTPEKFRHFISGWAV